MAKQRVLVVEDDPRVQRAIELLVEGTALEIELAGCARDALARIEVFDPAVALVDLGLPDLDGVELIARIHARRPAVVCIVLTVASSEERIRAALRAGARGYLFKEDLGRRLLVAIEEASLGGLPLSKAVAELLLAQVRGQTPAAGATNLRELTARERDVLERLALSFTYEEIAADLSVSINTVRTHVRAIYDKLEVSTRTEAVIAALSRGLLPPA